MKTYHTAAAIHGIDVTTAAIAYESHTGSAPSADAHWNWMVDHSVALGRFQSTSEVYGPITVLYRTDNSVSLFEGSKPAVPVDLSLTDDSSELLWEAYELLGLYGTTGIPAGDPQWLLVLNAQNSEA